MPIRNEFRHLYTGPVWREIRARILARAHDRCERCRKPNHSRVVYKTCGGRLWWKRPAAKLWRNQHGRWSHTPLPFGSSERSVFVVLTIAHLNQVPGDDRDENLAALCQWCHLHHDREQHTNSARVTRTSRKDAARPLLQATS